MRKAFRIILRILLCLVMIAAAFILLLTAAEYRPADTETLPVSGASSQTLRAGETLKIVTWNTGYGALGDNADFFMDGGKGVTTADKERVLANTGEMAGFLADENPDLVLLQEVDVSSKRSHYVNETQLYREAFPEYLSVFAYNYRALYVPYPLPTIGKVESGLQTLSRFRISGAERIALPCPFKWPVSTVNLKRGLLVTRIPVSESDAELVLVNLHLEAYDSGEGKAEQTRVLSEFLLEEYRKGNYVIAGGDFNQVFSNTDVSAYPVFENHWQPGLIDASGFDAAFTLVMDPHVPTCRSLDQPYAGADKENFQFYVIDGFIISDNMTIEGYDTISLDFIASDHNPVRLSVSLQ